MIDSVADTTTNADIAVYIDDDQIKDYQAVRGKYRVFSGMRLWPCKSLNLMVREMPGYAAYGAATDDSEFVSIGWDRWILSHNFPGGLGAFCPQTIGGYTKRMDFPWVSGKWAEMFGLVPLDAMQFYWDVAVQLVAEETCIVYGTESNFGIKHDEMFPSPEDRDPNDKSKEPVTDYGRRVLYVYADAKETCKWIALERQAMVQKIKDAIKEAV